MTTRPINNLDVTSGKRFNFTKRTQLEFQAQFLNFLNHPPLHSAARQPSRLNCIHGGRGGDKLL